MRITGGYLFIMLLFFAMFSCEVGKEKRSNEHTPCPRVLSKMHALSSELNRSGTPAEEKVALEGIAAFIVSSNSGLDWLISLQTEAGAVLKNEDASSLLDRNPSEQLFYVVRYEPCDLDSARSLVPPSFGKEYRHKLLDSRNFEYGVPFE